MNVNEKNNELEDKKYASVFQEYKRHFTIKKRLKNNFKTVDEAWDAILKVVARVYKIKSEDSFFLGENIKVGKNNYEIDRLTDKGDRREFAFKTTSVDKSYKKATMQNEFTTSFVIRRKMMSSKILIKYNEHVYAYEEMFGMKAQLAKFGFKREIKKNKKILEGELSK